MGGVAPRPDPGRDAHGVDEAHAALDRAYAMLDEHLSGHEWLAGAAFTLADCAAAAALYSGRVLPRWDEQRLRQLTRYFGDLVARTSVARVIDEARPYRALFP